MDLFRFLPHLILFLIAFCHVVYTDNSPTLFTKPLGSSSQSTNDDTVSTPESDSSLSASDADEYESVSHSTTSTYLELDLTLTQSSTQYEYSHNADGTHTYKAKNGLKFYKIKKGDFTVKKFNEDVLPVNLVVKYSEHGHVLLSSYYGDTEDFVFSVLKDPDPSASLKNVETLSVATTTFTVISGEAYADAIKQTVEQDSAEGADAGFVDLTNLFNYAFNTDANCTEVTYGNKTLWNHDRSKHGEHYPTNVLLNMKTKFLFIESEGNYQYFYSYQKGAWKPGFGYSSLTLPIDFQKLSLLTSDENGLNVAIDTKLYDPKNSLNTYTCTFKNGTKCAEVTYANLTLWKHNKHDHGFFYPKKVTLNTESNVVMVDAPSKYLYLYTFDSGYWSCIFAHRTKYPDIVYPSSISLYTLDDDGTITMNDLNKFVINNANNLLTFRINDDAKCDEVKYANKTLWKYSIAKHGDNFPTLLTLNKEKNMLILDSATHYRHVYGFDNSTWVELPFEFKKGELIKSKLTLVTQTDDGTESINDNTKYTVESHFDSLIFKFNDDVKCTQVKYADELVWHYSSDEHQDIYPTLVRLNTNNDSILVESTGKYSYHYDYYCDKLAPRPFGDLTSDDVLSNLKFVTFVNSKFFQNETAHFSIEKRGHLSTFKFKDRVKCNEVKYVDVSVWKYNVSEHGSDFPTSVTLNTKTGFLFVESTRTYLSFYTYNDRKWRPIYFHRSKTPTEPISPDSLNFFCDDQEQYVELATDTFAVEESSHIPGIYTFSFTMGTKCSLVKYGDEELWKHDQSAHGDNHLTSVTLNTFLAMVTIQSFGNYYYIFAYSNNWLKIYSRESTAVLEEPVEEDKTHKPANESKASERSVTLVTVDVTSTSGTAEFEYKESDGLATFDAVDGYGFNKVVCGTDVVWESTEPSLFVKTVTRKSLPRPSTVAEVTITFSDDKTKQFIKHEQNWIDEDEQKKKEEENKSKESAKNSSETPEAISEGASEPATNSEEGAEGAKGEEGTTEQDYKLPKPLDKMNDEEKKSALMEVTNKVDEVYNTQRAMTGPLGSPEMKAVAEKYQKLRDIQKELLQVTGMTLTQVQEKIKEQKAKSDKTSTNQTT